jgi:pilus assembly protein CpaF
MSLSDRLAQRMTTAVAPAEVPTGAHRLTTPDTTRRPGRVVDPFAAVKRNVTRACSNNSGRSSMTCNSKRELELQVTQTLQAVLQRDETPLTVADRARVAQEVADEILGHGPLEPYLRDPGISEIMVNGYDQIYVEREGRLYPVAASFTNENHLRRVIDKIVARVGRRVDE